MADLESLNIKINAISSDAVTSINQLVSSLSALNKSMSGINSSKLVSMSAGMSQLNTSAMLYSSSATQGAAATNRLNSSLSRTSGQARRAGNELNNTNRKLKSSTSGLTAIASVIGRIYAALFMVIRGFKSLWKALQKAMSYKEITNYFAKSIDQLATSATQKWIKAGKDGAEAYYNSFRETMLKTTEMMSGFTIGENGSLQESKNATSLGLNPSALLNYQTLFMQMADSIGEAEEYSIKLSDAMTKLGADLSSVKNVDFSETWQNLSSGVMSSMARAVDKFGINVRAAAQDQKLLELGIDATSQALGQQEKALLRGIIALDSSRYAWGDLADTIETPANSLRKLKANVDLLGQTIGNIFLPMFAKILPYLNAFVIALQKIAALIVELLGFSDFEFGSVGTEFSDVISDILDDVDDATDGVEDLKKAVKDLMGFDEINRLSDEKKNDSKKDSEYLALLQAAFDKVYNEYMKRWQEAYDGIDSDTEKLADRIFECLKNAFKTLDFSEICSSLVTGLGEAIENINPEVIGSALLGLILHPLSLISGTLGDDSSEYNFASFVSDILKFLTKVFEYIGKHASSIADTIAAFITNIVEAIFQIIAIIISHPELLLAIAELFVIITEAIEMGIIKAIIEIEAFLIRSVTKIVSNFSTILQRIANGEKLRDILADILPEGEELYGTFYDFQLSMIDSLADSIEELIDAMRDEKENLFAGLTAKEFVITVGVVLEMAHDVWINKVFNPWYEKVSGTIKNSKAFYVFVYLAQPAIKWYNQVLVPWFNRLKQELLQIPIVVKLVDSSKEFYTKYIKPFIDNIKKYGVQVALAITLLQTAYQFSQQVLIPWIKGIPQQVLKIKAAMNYTPADWFKNTFTPWFKNVYQTTSKSLLKLGVTLPTWDELKAGISYLVARIKDYLNVNLIDKINALVTIHVDPNIAKLAGIPSTFSLFKIPHFSTGGFPEDGLFMANHNELVGQFSNGRTAVANNQQITDGIRQATYEAFMEAFSRTGGQNVNVVLEGDAKGVFKLVQNQARTYSMQTGNMAFI